MPRASATRRLLRQPHSVVMKLFKGRIHVWKEHTLLAMITGSFPYTHNNYVDGTGPCRMSFEKHQAVSCVLYCFLMYFGFGLYSRFFRNDVKVSVLFSCIIFSVLHTHTHTHICIMGPRGSVIGWGTMLQAGRSRVPFPMRSLDFFNLPNPSSRTVALGSTQPVTKMSTRNLPGG
jgi:hypothetical protein